MFQPRKVLLAGLMVLSAGALWAGEKERLEFLNSHWRKAAILYNGGLFSDAAKEFEIVQTILPDDELTKQYLQKCREVEHIGTRSGGEIPMKREFNLPGGKTVPAMGSAASSKKAAKNVAAPTPENVPVPLTSPLPGVPLPPAEQTAESPVTPPTLTKQEMEVIYSKGVSLLNTGDYSGALVQFDTILAAKPDHQPSLIRAKKCRAELKKLKMKK